MFRAVSQFEKNNYCRGQEGDSEAYSSMKMLNYGRNRIFCLIFAAHSVKECLISHGKTKTGATKCGNPTLLLCSAACYSGIFKPSITHQLLYKQCKGEKKKKEGSFVSPCLRCIM